MRGRELTHRCIQEFEILVTDGDTLRSRAELRLCGGRVLRGWVRMALGWARHATCRSCSYSALGPVGSGDRTTARLFVIPQ